MEDNVLFVGEGDFSFSANYILKNRNKSDEKVYATCLNSALPTERQRNNIEIIKHSGGFVYTDVDATCLECHPAIKDIKFSKIIFNFPHIPGKMNIRKNRKLVQQFFLSAEKILTDNGTIWVTLCQGQGGTPVEKVERKWCDTWQIVSLAACASLTLNRIEHFDANEYKIYKCTGFRGLEKPFNTEGALTHIFCRGESVFVPLSSDDGQCYKNVESFLKHCEKLHGIIRQKMDSPYLKSLCMLNRFTRKNFQLVHEVTIPDLLICPKFSLTSHLDGTLNDDDDLCEECLNNLFWQFLHKRNDYLTTLISSNCCIKNINPKIQPFYHFLSYFCEDEYLISYVPVFLEYLNEEYSLSKNGENLLFDKCNTAFCMKQISNFPVSCLQSLSICSINQSSAENILNFYANCVVNTKQQLYSNINFSLSKDNSYTTSRSKCMKVGSVIKYFHNLKPYTCILINLDLLACLKFHVMDHRILFSENTCYKSEVLSDSSLKVVYRSPSLYPSSYVHDISFYIDKGFSENYLYLVLRNTVGDLISDVMLIDSYYDKQKQQYSQCYRLIYQSCDKALSKEKANVIHTKIIRKTLEKSLNICLR